MQKFLTGQVAFMLQPPAEKRRALLLGKTFKVKPDDPRANEKRLEESIAKKAASLLKRKERILELERQLKQLDAELGANKKPPLPSSLPPSKAGGLSGSKSLPAIGAGAGSGPPSCPKSGVDSGVTSGASSPKHGRRPNNALEPLQVQLERELKAALLDIAREQWENEHGKLPTPSAPGRLPPLGYSQTTDDLEEIWWNAQQRPKWEPGRMSDTLSFRPITMSRQAQRKQDKVAHGVPVHASLTPSSPPHTGPPPLEGQKTKSLVRRKGPPRPPQQIVYVLKNLHPVMEVASPGHDVDRR